PAGSNSAGYSNPAVDALINQALYTTNTTERINLVKSVEATVAADIPWNILYYRKNVVAWRNDAWEGWVLYPNGNAQFNFYSLVNIRPATLPPTGRVTYQGLTATTTKTIESTIGPPMPSAQLALSTPTPVIRTGGTAQIKATVTNSAGVGIANLPIAIEKNITAGGVSPLSAT